MRNCSYNPLKPNFFKYNVNVVSEIEDGKRDNFCLNLIQNRLIHIIY